LLGYTLIHDYDILPMM